MTATTVAVKPVNGKMQGLLMSGYMLASIATAMVSYHNFHYEDIHAHVVTNKQTKKVLLIFFCIITYNEKR